ncbi:MAG: hypothetical protein LH481_00315 [Burkholderiales bacterium]|nr:hypothetical protein [Burkholderiales bacterium]
MTTSLFASAFATTPPNGLVLSIVSAPRISTVGTARSIFVHGASGPVTFDESAIATTGTLVIRMTPEMTGLMASPLVLTYTPRNIGTLRVSLRLSDGSAAETQMETVAGARSTFNLDGMWFDPATNGSGISFHHAVASDVVFGTWFLYAAQPQTRWYSLQSMQWMQGGTVLVGIAYEGRTNNVNPACLAGDDCPRPAVELRTVGSVSVTVIDQNNLRVEALDQYGRTAFVSLLKRL